MRKPLKTFIFILLFLCAQPIAKAIEEIVNPLLSWRHVQTFFSDSYGSRVYYIYKKNRREADKKNSFLVCSYPRIYGLSLESKNPSSNCFSKGEKYSLDELNEFLLEKSKKTNGGCPELELMYSVTAPQKVIEHILSGVTFLPSLSVFHCEITKEIEPIASSDGSVSFVENVDKDLIITSGGNAEIRFKKNQHPGLSIKSRGESLFQSQKLPCFPEEKIETRFTHKNGVFEEAEYGSEANIKFNQSKKSLYGRLLKLGKSIPGFKTISRKEISKQLSELIPEKEFQPTRSELKEMVDQVAMASSSNEASENMYVFGATLILQRLIKQVNLTTGEDKQEKALCETLDSDCHQVIGKSIYGFKSCLSEHISKKSGADKCVEQFISKAIGQLAFDVSELLIEDYVDKKNAELLCLDKNDSCDENFCSKANCVEQAMIVLKNKARNQIRECFKSFNPLDKKGESLLEDRLFACVSSGLISATDYLVQVGGPKKIISVGKKYLHKHGLQEQAQALVSSFLSKNSLKSCVISNLSSPEAKERDTYDYQTLAKAPEEKIIESMFSCVDKTSFDLTEELMKLVLPHEIGNSLESVVENEESRDKIVQDVIGSLIGENGEFQKCAESEMMKAKQDREDDNDHTNYEVDPERCLVPLSAEAYSQSVIGLIGDQLRGLSTSPDRINASLGDDYFTLNRNEVGGEWKEDLVECQQSKKENILESNLQGEELENLIEKSTVECAILGIGDAAKIITLDELINHPKVKKYEITLGNRYEKKVSEAVKSCIIDEFQKESVETINRLGEVFPKAKEKCQDVAIHKTLHPDVTKSIIRDLLEENLEGTDYTDLVSEVAPTINTLYECNYYRLSVTSPKYTQCSRIYKKYGLDTSKFFVKGIPEDKVLEFLEGEFTKSAYKIVISEVLREKSFDTVSEKLGGELSDEEKREVSAAVRSSRAIDKGVDLFMEKNSMERIESELEGMVTKSLAPVVLKHMLLRKKYDHQVVTKAENNLTKCLSPIDHSKLNEQKTERGYLCKAIDICISREVLAIAKNEGNQVIDSIINGLGNDEKWGHQIIKKYSKMKAKEYVDACIEKEITCEDYTTFPNYPSEIQKYTIISCLLN